MTDNKNQIAAVKCSVAVAVMRTDYSIRRGVAWLGGLLAGCQKSNAGGREQEIRFSGNNEERFSSVSYLLLFDSSQVVQINNCFAYSLRR